MTITANPDTAVIHTDSISETPAPRPFALVRHCFAMAKRGVYVMRRTPEQFFDVTLQPIIFILLFVYIFGGAVAGSTHDYLQYVLPALMVQTVMFSSMTIGVNLNTDIGKGVFDRFRSLPIARSAPLIGAVLADVVRYLVSIVVLVVTGSALGFRFHNGIHGAIGGCVMCVFFALCITWIAVLLGMLLREPGGVQGLSFLLMFPLTFGSNMFVQADTMPGWLQAWVHNNPVTHLVTAIRGMWLGGPILTSTLWTIAWGLGILAVFFPMAVRAYRRRT
jgi:oleandomycin transport system permease protein